VDFTDVALEKVRAVVLECYRGKVQFPCIEPCSGKNTKGVECGVPGLDDEMVSHVLHRARNQHLGTSTHSHSRVQLRSWIINRSRYICYTLAIEYEYEDMPSVKSTTLSLIAFFHTVSAAGKTAPTMVPGPPKGRHRDPMTALLQATCMQQHCGILWDIP